MPFDLGTAFAVREREDGLLEKDTFDLGSAMPIETEIRAVRPEERRYVPPTTEEQKAQAVVALTYREKGEQIPIGLQMDWALTSPKAQAITQAALVPELTILQGIRGAIDTSGGYDLIDRIQRGILQSEDTKRFYEYIPGAETMPKWAKITANVGEDIIALGLMGYGKAVLRKELLTRNITRRIDEAATEFADEAMTKYLPSGYKAEEAVRQSLKTEFKNRLLARLSAPEIPSAEMGTLGKLTGEIEPSVLQNYASRKSLFSLLAEEVQVVGERGFALIPKIGQTVQFTNPQGIILKGTIKEIIGQRAIIDMDGRQIVAVLSQLSKVIPELAKPEVTVPEEIKPPQPPIEKQPQKPIQPEMPEIPPITPPPEKPPIPLEPSMPQEPDAVKRVIQALKEAKPIRKEQEVLMKAERGRRIAQAKAMGEKITGEAGFYAQLGSLKGELPKAQFETLRGKITQTDIDTLFNQIRTSPMNEWDKIGAQTGLGKLFGEFGGQVPTEGELKVLYEVFGKEFTDALLANRTLMQKFMHATGELLNIPRAVMASFDLSAPLRQGVFMIGRPKQFVPAFGEMFKYFGSEKALTALTQEIASRPTYKLMREHKLSLTDLGTSLTTREEKFQSSWAEKIPLAGIGVRASNRAYVGFLNKLRVDVFDDLYNKAKSLGIEETDKFLDDLCEFISAATGRGKLPGQLEKTAVALNATFFSPRLMASRLSLLNPAFYITKEPFVRKEALKSLLLFAGAAMTILGLCKLSGVEVGTDWRSSDFGKIKIGNTRIDIFGGFQPYIRMAGQLITGEYVSSVTGKVITLGEGYKPLTRFDILLRQLENKEAPVASFITSLLRQKTFMGEDVNITTEIINRFTPMALSDFVDLAKENPALLPLGILGLFGVGLQTYESKLRSSSTRSSSTTKKRASSTK